jgi:tetratricopeptide (TPR) repeat protein
VTRAIVDALRVHLTPNESARVGQRGTVDLDAYDYFVRGRQQLQRYTAASVAEAGHLFEHALALDPNFAAAHAGLGLTIKNDLLNQRALDREAAQRRVEEHMAKAAALDPNEPFLHYLRATDHLSRREIAEAERHVRELLKVEPSSDLAHGLLAQCFVLEGRAAEAVPEIEYAMRLNPHFPDLYLHILGHAQLLLRDWPAAEDTLRRRIRRNPTTDASRLLLTSLLGHLGRVEEAHAEWAELLRQHPDFVLAERRKGWMYSSRKDEEFVWDGLRRAGVAD